MENTLISSNSKKNIKLYCIIHSMLEICKRWGPAFFTAFAVLMGVSATVYTFPNPKEIIIAFILLLLSIFALILSIFCFIYDIKDGKKKDREEKDREFRVEFEQAVRTLHPEYTEEQIKWFIEGK